MSSASSTHWNLDAYQQLQLPHPDHPEDGHTDVVYRVHLQGNHLVSVSADRTVRVWDLRTRRLLHPPLVGHTGSVLVVQFDATAQYDVILTGATDGNVMVWRYSTGELLKTIAEAHDGSILSLHFDHRYLVTGGRDGKIKLWNRHYLEVDDTEVPECAVRPTGGNGYQEYNLLAIFDGHHAAINALKLKDDVIVSGSGDSTICIWSLRNGEILHKINNQSGFACIQYNVRFIVSGSTDNSARIHDVNQKVEVACLKGHSNLIRSVQAVFDDWAEVETVISGSYDGSVRIWGREPGSQKWRTEHQFHISCFQAYEDARPVAKLDRFDNRIFSIDLDADRFVCSGQGPVIRIWDLRSPKK